MEQRILLFHQAMVINALMFFVITNGLSLGSLSLLAAMLLRMDKSKLGKELPMFFGYLAFALMQGTALFSIRHYFGYYSSEYFLAYWLLATADTVLAFFFIHEVYAKML